MHQQQLRVGVLLGPSMPSAQWSGRRVPEYPFFAASARVPASFFSTLGAGIGAGYAGRIQDVKLGSPLAQVASLLQTAHRAPAYAQALGNFRPYPQSL
jgi:hypothetical protein